MNDELINLIRSASSTSTVVSYVVNTDGVSNHKDVDNNKASDPMPLSDENQYIINDDEDNISSSCQDHNGRGEESN